MRHAIAMFRAWTTSHEDSFGSFTSGMISFRDCIGLLRNDGSRLPASPWPHFRWVDDLIETLFAHRFWNTVVFPWVSSGRHGQKYSMQIFGRIKPMATAT